jgi:hypothetical protein
MSICPANALEATSSVTLGGPKYSELEIQPVLPISDLVYGAQNPPLESKLRQGEYPSGQRTATVNRQAHAFAGSTPASPITRNPADALPRFQPSKYERLAGKNGEAVINQKRRVTLPQRALLGAGLRDGDRVRATSDGPGRIVLEKAGLPVWAEPS